MMNGGETPLKKLENMLKHQLNEENAVIYPDFDSMWGRVEQAANTVPLKTDTAGGHWFVPCEKLAQGNVRSLP